MSLPTHNAVSLQGLEETADYDRFAKYNEFERMQAEGVELEDYDKTTLGLTEGGRSAEHSSMRLNFQSSRFYVLVSIKRCIQLYCVENTIILCD